MAQLVKLKDYISRYEWDPYRYPTQYIRIKKENWQELYSLWKNNQKNYKLLNEETKEEAESRNHSSFSKLNFFQQKTKESWQLTDTPARGGLLPHTEMELRHYFLDKLFPFQIKWATSTVTHMSFMDQAYNNDKQLKYFLQRFPDIYLVMFYPVFNIRKAPVDTEIILISPVGIDIISLLEFDDHITVMAGDDRTWALHDGKQNSNIISPLISLKRTEQIIKSILQANNITYPIKKNVLSRTNNIVFTTQPYNTSIIGTFQYEEWFQQKRKLTSALKSDQLKVVELLLKHCLTNSVRRPEWEDASKGNVKNEK